MLDFAIPEGFQTRAVVLMNIEYSDLSKYGWFGDEELKPTGRAAKF
jgi:hypothetical protein